MIVYVVMTDKTLNDEIDEIFLHRHDAEQYANFSEYRWIEEHEVLQ